MPVCKSCKTLFLVETLEAAYFRNVEKTRCQTFKVFIVMENKKIYNLIILDASGSMERIYDQALSGVNETLSTIRRAQEVHPELHQYVSLASFSAGDDFLNRIYSAVPVSEAHDITPADYPLLGCTALYDAMGTCISELQQQTTHNDRVLVTIITDGYENASRTWDGKQIKSLVTELRGMGWTFTYIGADQDVERVASDLGVRNSLRFSANAEDTEKMFQKERACRSAFYSKICSFCMDESAPMTEDLSYFGD